MTKKDQRGLRKRSDQGRALLITFLSYNHVCSINNREKDLDDAELICTFAVV